MRVLLAAEGESDELAGERILLATLPDAVVVRKRFPSRGFQVVRRSIRNLVRAAHYQLFDLLVVHFDLDDSLPLDYRDVDESNRRQEIGAEVVAAIGQLTPVGRGSPILWVFMTPCKSTDAWLAWGRDDRDGRHWESKDRHQLKRSLFGDPARGIVAKCGAFCVRLLSEMGSNPDWPPSLRRFVDDVVTAGSKPGS